MMIVSWFCANIGVSGVAIAIVGYLFVKLFVYPTFFPNVIRYPWPNDNKKEKNKKKTTTAVLAGSFNPPHYGHLAMLTYLSEQYDQVIAVVGMNPNKKYAVTPRERANLIQKMLKSNNNNGNVQVEIVSDYIWRHLKRTHPQEYGNMVFCRGIRSWEKDGREEQYLQFQNTWGPLILGPLVWPLPTMFLEGKPEYNHVSSTLIRSVCHSKNATTPTDLHKLVPPSIAEDIAQLYSR